MPYVFAWASKKTGVGVKEVIISYIIPRLSFTPSHEPSPPSWKVVTNSVSSPLISLPARKYLIAKKIFI